MMLTFSLENPAIVMGTTSTCRLRISHTMEGTLFSLRFRISSSPEISLSAATHIEIAQLEPGDSQFLDISIRGKKPAPAEIRIDRICGRYKGKTLDFKDQLLPVAVIQDAAIKETDLIIGCDAGPLTQGSRGKIRLLLRNESTLTLVQPAFVIESPDLGIRAGQRIELEDLPSREQVTLIIDVTPGIGGPVDFKGHLISAEAQQAGPRNFCFHLHVKADETFRSVSIGDVVLTGKGRLDIFSTDLGSAGPHEDLDADLERRQLNFGLKGSSDNHISAASSSDPAQSLVQCPNCRSFVMPGTHCERCQFELPRGE